jgi:large-conductance mechanosensitive channel
MIKLEKAEQRVKEKSLKEKYSNLIVSYIDFLLLFFNFYFVIIVAKKIKHKNSFLQ